MLKVPKFELEKIVLKTIHEAPGVVFTDDSVHEATLTHAVRQRLPAEEIISNIQVAELVWSLIAHGLVYIDFSNRSSINWRLHVTDMGLAALKDESINPDNHSKYLGTIKEIVDDEQNIVLLYAEEALMAYRAQCFLSSTVMLGVASEATFYELANSFVSWLDSDNEKVEFSKILKDRRSGYAYKFGEFRKRLDRHKDEIRGELTDNLTITLDGVLNLLRVSRNETGHPTGKTVSRDDAFVILQMFPFYLKKIYDLKIFFELNN